MKAHSAKSKQDMTAREYFSAPQPVEEIVVKQNKSVIGKAFKAKAKDGQSALDAITRCEEDALRLNVRSHINHRLQKAQAKTTLVLFIRGKK